MVEDKKKDRELKAKQSMRKIKARHQCEHLNRINR